MFTSLNRNVRVLNSRSTIATSRMSSQTAYDYDLVVIGGGSGGMACAKQAASLGARVALFDYVKPSSQGTTWGLGGTCVNVGCVPKKIMHYAGLLGQSAFDAQELGWTIQPHKHDWDKLVETVRNHVRMLNFRYRGSLLQKDVNYINALAKFEDSHTLTYTLKGNSDIKKVTAANIVIAVGGRPNLPSDIPGAKEHAITSDDIFFLNRSPGKTLCVGGSYIALECAGFLTELGLDVTVASRSMLLRGFDRQCAAKIGSYMEDIGTKFLNEYSPKSIKKLASNKLEVILENKNGDIKQDIFDTVFFATGRVPDIAGLNLFAVGVKTDPKTSKILVTNEQTSVPHIYALGDVIGNGKNELTPVAIQAGNLLAKRLFGNSNKLMNYNMIPTTVFTPIEYGSVGLSEEQAVQQYGDEDIEVYLSEFTTLEVSAVHRKKQNKTLGEGDLADDMSHNCLSKLITVKSQGERVVGFHFVGPNAGEVTQGFALAVKLGATKSDFDDMIGIHPTDAESFCALSITKRSGEDFASGGGCGGGVCG